ncbi:exopolyphosphatase [Burkholderiaceae bacterium DAT-1]|nr:exopolyphosphatase [Burkholderiaceae bacterium DAT-1]
MTVHQTIAAVDLGSNSFRLQVARVEDNQIYPLDSLKDTVRFAAGLSKDNRLDDASQQRALAALSRFGERLRGFHEDAVRVVATNTLRVAKNAGDFLPRAEAALGFPIEVIAGREEARLIYIGAAHSLPINDDRRLVVDIGGGSTEFIIGQGYDSHKTESLRMGCVSWSMKFFPDGKLTKEGFRDAELAARAELQRIATEFSPEHWQVAIGTSGTARSLSDICEQNGLSASGISREGLERLRAILIRTGHLDKVQLDGLRPDRRPVLPGGFAIMAAVFAELGVDNMSITLGALRDGVLYDLIGRHHHRDLRDITVDRFTRVYGVEQAQQARVTQASLAYWQQLAVNMGIDPMPRMQMLEWAARLHEIGLSVAHTAYHKHSAYILQNADMPGFSNREQQQLAQLVLAHRGGIRKLGAHVPMEAMAQILALRLAAILNRSRMDRPLPPLVLTGVKNGFRIEASDSWIDDNPLSHMALIQEAEAWRDAGWRLDLSDSFSRWE